MSVKILFKAEGLEPTDSSPPVLYSEVSNFNIIMKTRARPGPKPVQESYRLFIERLIRHCETYTLNYQLERCYDTVVPTGVLEGTDEGTDPLA
jgi:hypothetical protein